MDVHIELYKILKKDCYEFITGKLSDFVKDVYPTETILASSKALGLTQGKKKFWIDNKEDVIYIFDYAINEIEIDGKKVIQVYKEKVGIEDEKEIEFSKAIENSYVTLFRVVNTSAAKGLVFIKDLFGDGKNIRLTDLSMSKTAIPGMLIFTRILPFQGINISSGMCCVFPASYESQLVREYQNHLRNNSIEDNQSERYIFFYNEYKKLGK